MTFMTHNEHRVSYHIQFWLESYSRNTSISYGKTTSDFINFIGSVEKITICSEKDIISFLNFLSPCSGKNKRGRPTLNISTSTKNQRLSCLNAMFKMLIKNECLGINPAQKIKISEEKPQKNPIVDIETITEGLDKISKIYDPTLRARNKFIALLLLSNALKRSEITNIRLEDIISEGIVIRNTKRSRLLHLNPSVLKAMKDWVKLRSSLSPYLLTSYARKEQGLEKLSNFAIRDFSMKFFKCCPQQLRTRSILDYWHRASNDIDLVHIHSGNHSKQSTIRQINKNHVAYLPDYEKK
jgi:site-specific recombinase XerD